jgi:hypothetical protein
MVRTARQTDTYKINQSNPGRELALNFYELHYKRRNNKTGSESFAAELKVLGEQISKCFKINKEHQKELDRILNILPSYDKWYAEGHKINLYNANPRIKKTREDIVSVFIRNIEELQTIIQCFPFELTFVELLQDKNPSLNQDDAFAIVDRLWIELERFRLELPEYKQDKNKRMIKLTKELVTFWTGELGRRYEKKFIADESIDDDKTKMPYSELPCFITCCLFFKLKPTEPDSFMDNVRQTLTNEFSNLHRKRRKNTFLKSA